MSNSNTIRQAKLPSAEINLGGTSTSEALFLNTSANGGGTLLCYIPGSGAMNKMYFRVTCCGRVVAGTGTPNFTASLYQGSAITSANKLASTGAIAIATTQGNWGLICDFFWDSSSQRLCGLQKGWVYGTALAQIITTNPGTTIDLNTATTSEGNSFCLTGTFGTGNASNAAYVDKFEITML